MITSAFVKICGYSVQKPLEMIFKQNIETVIFTSEWKRVILFPFTGKETNKH